MTASLDLGLDKRLDSHISIKHLALPRMEIEANTFGTMREKGEKKDVQEYL